MNLPVRIASADQCITNVLQFLEPPRVEPSVTAQRGAHSA